MVLNSQEAKTNYLIEHYWDNFNFIDTTAIEIPEFSEQAFTDYIQLILKLPLEKAEKSVRFLMNKAEANKKMYKYFMKLGEKYFYDPNSPVRNEVLYELFLKESLHSKVIGEVLRIRFLKQYKLVQKNNVGHIASDFVFTLTNGFSSSLYSIKAKLTLIDFNNPDCEECKKVNEKIQTSTIINELTYIGTLKILVIYTDDDLTIWERHHKNIPGNWINAYDKGTMIQKKDLYDLKAMPTLYLLDGDKRVLLKDESFEKIEKFLLKS